MKAALAGLLLVACGPPAGDDGPPADSACTHGAPGLPTNVGTIGAPSNELSGLIASATTADLLYTHADAGNAAAIYAIDARNANLLGTLRVANATNVDWEDLTRAPCEDGSACIVIADTGDNLLNRASVRFYAIPDRAPPAGVSQDVTATIRDVTYPDGAHDVEAVYFDPRDGELYGIDKVDTPDPVVWRYPRAQAMAVEVTRLDLSAFAGDRRVTSADMHVDACGVQLLVRTADHLLAYGADFTAPQSVPVADEPRGEAVAWQVDGGGYYTVSEVANVLFHVSR